MHDFIATYICKEYLIALHIPFTACTSDQQEYIDNDKDALNLSLVPLQRAAEMHGVHEAGQSPPRSPNVFRSSPFITYKSC